MTIMVGSGPVYTDEEIKQVEMPIEELLNSLRDRNMILREQRDEAYERLEELKEENYHLYDEKEKLKITKNMLSETLANLSDELRKNIDIKKMYNLLCLVENGELWEKDDRGHP